MGDMEDNFDRRLNTIGRITGAIVLAPFVLILLVIVVGIAGIVIDAFTA